MKKVLIIVTIALYLAFASQAKAQGEMKHGLIAGGIAFGISAACEATLKDSWGCWLAGVIPTFIGAAVFEAVQNDTKDAHNDIAASGFGALIGAGMGVAIAIDF